MPFDLVLAGGSVLTSRGVVTADVAITADAISSIGTDLGDAPLVIDCSGSWVGPGFVDIHAHLREPGGEWKETIASGSAAAAAGGYTALVSMPNTDPVIDNGHMARFVSDRARETGLVQITSAGCLTMGRAGKHMAHLDDMWNAGVRMFTDDGDSVGNAEVLKTCMEYIEQLGGVVAQHAVDADLGGGGHMHEGSVSSLLGMVGIPSEADEITLIRDISLARLTGVQYHAQHLSTARSVEIIAEAKAEGLAVTAEVTPHHLMFDHTNVAGTDPRFKMMPPLRHPRDCEALREGLRNGTIDVVATDHAPHASFEKDVPFEEAPNGVIGLEWAASAVQSTMALDQQTFFERMSIAPGTIASTEGHGRPLEVGGPANIAVFDPETKWTPTRSLSKSVNSPYFGIELSGRVTTTVFGGRITHEVEQ